MTNLRVPELTGYAKILAAASESVGLCTLTGLPVAQVGLAVECMLPSGLRNEPPVTVEGVLSGDQLSSLAFILVGDILNIYMVPPFGLYELPDNEGSLLLA